MSFDEIVFPLSLSAGTSGGPCFATEVVTIDGGFERRNQKWAQPRRRYNAQAGVVTMREAALLTAFFHARAGRARGFRLRDASDCTSAADGLSAPDWRDQEIGIGDGVTTQFQLVKTYGNASVSFAREIKKPVAGSVRVGVDDTEYTSGWSVDVTRGIVSFAQAPASGVVIKAGYRFDVPVRFDTDTLDLSFVGQSRAQGNVPLIEVRTP